MRIYFFSRPIHSGKTTELQQWCDRHQDIAGILMPDVDGLRKVLDLQTKTQFDIECADTANTNEELTSVGRFHFYSTAFEKANTILIDALAKNPGWMVIDEAGKLEMDGKGFYPALKKAFSFYADPETSGNLLVTVRDSLCFEVISFFNVKCFRVIYSLEELD